MTLSTSYHIVLKIKILGELIWRLMCLVYLSVDIYLGNIAFGFNVVI